MSTILVADDEVDVAEVLEVLLTEAGYRVWLARNGREAVRLAGECRPALVMLDVMMPVLDGAGVLRALRADPELAAVPVVLMSAGPRIEHLAREQGVADWLRKPFQLDRLLSTVRRLVPLDGAPHAAVAADSQAPERARG